MKRILLVGYFVASTFALSSQSLVRDTTECFNNLGIDVTEVIGTAAEILVASNGQSDVITGVPDSALSAFITLVGATIAGLLLRRRKLKKLRKSGKLKD